MSGAAATAAAQLMRRRVVLASASGAAVGKEAAGRGGAAPATTGRAEPVDLAATSASPRPAGGPSNPSWRSNAPDTAGDAAPRPQRAGQIMHHLPDGLPISW